MQREVFVLKGSCVQKYLQASLSRIMLSILVSWKDLISDYTVFPVNKQKELPIKVFEN